jgi:hypothetical protein
MSKTETIAADIHAERSAICEFDGLLTREQAEAQGKLEADEYRMACETRYVLAMPFAERKPYLSKVEQQRGRSARDVLAKAINDEWISRKAK